MKCRPNQFAMIISGCEADLGAVVCILRTTNPAEYPQRDVTGQWECKPLSPINAQALDGTHVRTTCLVSIPDHDLFPLNNTPLQDQTITWAGHPPACGA